MEYQGLMFVLFCLVALAVTAAASHRDKQVIVRELGLGEDFDHELCKRLAGLSGIPKQHAAWPRLWSSVQDLSGQTLVGSVDGLVVGRAILEAPHHPYCELVNLCVRPDYRGRGVATAIVRESIRRAREMGFKYMVVQEDKDSPAAHGIYEKAGFLNATVGEMHRLIHLLDVPLVSTFVHDHPDADFVTEAAPEFGERWWQLLWRSGNDHVALFVHGGSCQFDSDGLQPVVQACEFVCGNAGLMVKAEMVTEVRRGEMVELREGKLVRNELAELAVVVENCGAQSFTGMVRAVLLPDTDVVGELATSVPQIKLEPGESTTIRLPIRVRHEFICDAQGVCSYPSAPLTAEICWEGGSILLSVAVKIK